MLTHTIPPQPIALPVPEPQYYRPIKTVTSLSGGKSSAYMAVHFPTDYYVFAVVLTTHAEAAPQDPGLLRECQNRIPGFIASRELDQTLLNVLRLEQELGKPVQWISATESQHKPGMMRDKAGWLPVPLTYDALINYRVSLPNRDQRWCTEQLKIMAIFWHCYLHLMESDADIIQMNIGFRWDEGKRVDDMLNRCDKVEFPYQCPVDAKHRKQKHQWKKLDWRIPRFPMHEAGIDHLEVIRYWLDRGWSFPSISNCDGCFHHTAKQLQRQADLYPDRLQWWTDQESKRGATWKNGISYADILQYRQLDLLEDTQGSCFCTD